MQRKLPQTKVLKMMTYHSKKIQGRAKATVLEHGAYLSSNSQPCDRHCPQRSEDCHGKCKKWKEWDELHKLALEEKRRAEAEIDITNLKPKPRKEWDQYRIPNIYIRKNN